MKNAAKIGFIAAGLVIASTGVANANGRSTVGNTVDISTSTSTANVNVNVNKYSEGWDKYSNTATKVDYINESIALPDDLGTKDIYTEITAVSESSGMSDFNVNEHTNVQQTTITDGKLMQEVTGYAGVNY